MYETMFLIEESNLNIEEGLYQVVLESSDIVEMKKETIEKLKNSRSVKERQKWLKRLKNLNKIKRVKDEKTK